MSVNIYFRFLLVFLGTLFLSIDAKTQCEIAQPYLIADEDTTVIQLVVEGASFNNLGVNNSLCAVHLEFDHNVVGDIQIKLISPSGQSILLVGPLASSQLTTIGTTWDIDFVQCSFVASPNLGFGPVWNNQNSWLLFTNYTNASYYPFFGCLEDFNTGSVSGTWTLEVIDGAQFDNGDVFNFSLEFCSGSIANCSDCVPDAGTLVTEDLSFCEGNPLLDLELSPDYGTGVGPSSSAYDYLYLVSSGGFVVAYNESPSFASLPVGNYQICGMSILSADIPSLPVIGSAVNMIQEGIDGFTLCADITEDCFLLDIISYDLVTPLMQSICAGDTIFIEDTPLYETGVFIVYKSNGSCDEVFEVTVENANIIAFINNTTEEITCENPSVNIEGFNSNYNPITTINWYSIDGGVIIGNTDEINITVSTGGTYVLELSQGNCISRDTIFINSDLGNIDVEIIGANIDCNNASVQLVAQSSTVGTYAWILNNTTIATSTTIVASSPGEYTVEFTTIEGCKAIDIYTVVVDTIVVEPLFTSLPIDCGSSTTTINTVGTTGNQYHWTNMSGFDSMLEDPVVSESGIYSVAILGTNGCMDTFDHEVLIDTLAPTVTYDTDLITCDNPEANITAIVGSNVNVVWSNDNMLNILGNTLITTESGIYYLEATGANDCVFRDTFNIGIDTIAPQFEVFDATIPCTSTNTMLINNYNPADGIIFEWSYNDIVISELPEPTVTLTGTYYVTASLGNGCSVLDSIFVDKTNGIDNISIQADTITCNNSLAHIEMNLDAGYSFLWSNNAGFSASTADIDVTDPGVYSVLITDLTTLCIENLSVNVVIDTIIPPYEINFGVIDCTTQSTNVLFSDMGEGASISWTGPEVNIVSDYEFITSVPGTYYLDGIARNGCSFKDTINIISDGDVPSLVFDPLVVNCLSDNFTITHSSNVSIQSYNWSGPDGFNSNLTNPVISTAGVYTVDLIGANGCEGSSSINVASDSTLIIIDIMGETTLLCNRTEIAIEASTNTPPVSTSWTGPMVNVLDIDDIIVDMPGWYYYTAVNVNGCQATDSIEIIDQSFFPEISIDYNDINCYSMIADVQLNTNNEQAAVLWTSSNPIIDGSSITSFTTQVPGTYSVSVDAGSDCISTQEFIIIEDLDDPVISTLGMDTIFCYQRMVPLDISVNTMLDSVRWSGADNYTSDELNPLVADGGIYNVIVTGNNGCTATAMFTVEVDTIAPVGSTIGGTLSCLDSKLDLTADIGENITSFYWEGPDGYFSTDTMPTIIVPGDYFLVLSTINGCITKVKTEVIDNLSPPSVNPEDQNLPCNDDSIELLANTTQSNIQYNWFGPNNYYSSAEVPTTNIPGQYILIALGENGCIINDTFQVTQIPIYPLYTVLQEDITCVVSTPSYSALDVEDDDGVLWTLPDGSTSNNSSISSALNGQFELIVTGTNGCMDTSYYQTSYDTVHPVALITTDEFIMCEVREILLSSAGSSTGNETIYAWSSDNTQSFVTDPSGLDVTINQPGTYQLMLTNSVNGCTDETEIEIVEQENTFQNVTLLPQDPSCYEFFDGFISIDNVEGGLGDLSYTINNTSTIDEPLFVDLNAGVYNIIVTDAFGCTVEAQTILMEPTEVIVNVQDDVSIQLGDSLLLDFTASISQSDIFNIQWTTTPTSDICIDCMDQIFIPTENMTIGVEIFDENDCSSYDEFEVIIDQSRDIYVPNIFTPNGDGNNDVLMIGAHNGVELIQDFEIIDRWGNRVFYEKEGLVDDLKFQWDGSFKNKILNSAVFAYVIRFKMLSGDERIKHGTITLVN